MKVLPEKEPAADEERVTGQSDSQVPEEVNG
jgi:hypothetical protein